MFIGIGLGITCGGAVTSATPDGAVVDDGDDVIVDEDGNVIIDETGE